ncbi:hypothetical protein HDU98_001652 [Podochytrium sp. JEL0797]|nr:hypothetical protein HDU98_001652 [Podochytrium sp. JEL0797]
MAQPIPSGLGLGQIQSADVWNLVQLASPIIGRSADSYLRTRRLWMLRFSAFFGIYLFSAIDLWGIVKSSFHAHGLKKIHMLWGLHFLKVYPTEYVGAATWSTSESNWRSKVQEAVKCFSEMEEIDFEDRWINWDCPAPSAYVDGVDIAVCEAHPFNTDLFSHKFHRAGIRFQVATALGTSRIVHISGGLPCGANPDLLMVRRTLLKDLEDGELVAADQGYRGDARILVKLGGNSPGVREHNHNLNQMGARHETVNKRLKDFRVLSSGLYRVDRQSLTQIFVAVAQITNVKLRRQPLFSLEGKLR